MDRAGGRLDQPGQRPERGRLPRTIRADERDDAATRHLETDAVKRLDSTIGDLEIFDSKQGG